VCPNKCGYYIVSNTFGLSARLGFMQAMYAAKFISLCCYIKGVSNSNDVQHFNFQVDQKIILLLFSGVV